MDFHVLMPRTKASLMGGATPPIGNYAPTPLVQLNYKAPTKTEQKEV